MSEAPADLLPWDTEHFGHRIARARADRLRPEAAPALLAWCRDHAVACLYLLANTEDPETCRVAMDHGFRLVDVRLTLAREGPVPPPPPPPRPVRPAVAGDLPALEAVAASVHTDTRFFADPRLAPRAPALYRIWIAKSVQGEADAVWTVDHEGGAAAYVTCRVEGSGRGSIGLVGVHPALQGQGVGPALLRHALAWFAGRGIGHVEVVTQGRNLPAQRLYQRCGFEPASIRLWYHCWLTPDPSTA
jgi:dTDP-4-amino-4,6-dideoxy-D-galactose acyltransferase